MIQTGEKWDRLFCVKLNCECYEDAMVFLVFILILFRKSGKKEHLAAF